MMRQASCFENGKYRKTVPLIKQAFPESAFSYEKTQY